MPLLQNRPARRCPLVASLITSQNATAPKQSGVVGHGDLGLITSQNATAPKQGGEGEVMAESLITSQNATAPKQERRHGDALLV